MTSKRGRKAKKKTKRGRKASSRSSAPRMGAIVTRKLSASALKKLGAKLESVGTLGGKKAYKVVRAKRAASVAKPRRARATRAAKAPRAKRARRPYEEPAWMKAKAVEDDKKVVPGATLYATTGVTMQFAYFYRVVSRDGDRVVLRSIGKKLVAGDYQNGSYMPDPSKPGDEFRAKMSRGAVKFGRMLAFPWNGKPVAEFGD